MGFSHVLITRPQPEAGQLAALFGSGPPRPVVIPAFTFDRLADRLPRAWRRSRDGRSLAVFTSTRAVEFGLPVLSRDGPEGVETASIGPATAAALEQAGHAVDLVASDGYTSEALLADGRLSEDPGRALIFAAPGGRDALRRGLAALGWTVTVLHVYQRIEADPEPAEVEALMAAERVVSVWTSASAMESLAGSLPAAAWRRVLDGEAVVISDRLATASRRFGIAGVRVSAGPGNRQLHAAVMNLT